MGDEDDESDVRVPLLLNHDVLEEGVVVVVELMEALGASWELDLHLQMLKHEQFLVLD